MPQRFTELSVRSGLVSCRGPDSPAGQANHQGVAISCPTFGPSSRSANVEEPAPVPRPRRNVTISTGREAAM